MALHFSSGNYYNSTSNFLFWNKKLYVEIKKEKRVFHRQLQLSSASLLFARPDAPARDPHTLGDSDSDSTENRRGPGPSAATLDFPSSPPASTDLSNPLISTAGSWATLRSGDDGRRRRRLRVLDGAAGLARLPRAHAPALRRRVRQVHQEVSSNPTPAPPWIPGRNWFHGRFSSLVVRSEAKHISRRREWDWGVRGGRLFKRSGNSGTLWAAS